MKRILLIVALGWAGLAWAQGWNIGLLSTLPDSGIVSSVAAGNSYVYFTNAGLKTVDVTDPLNPRVVGYHKTPGSALAVAVESTYVYVADGDSGLRIINVSNPANPVEIDSCPGFAQNVTLANHYAYVVGGAWANLRIINITDPANANQVGSLIIMPGLTIAQDVAISGNYAYLAGGEVGLLVVDITDPTNPSQVGVYQGTMSDARCVVISGNYAYVSSLSTVNIIDITNPQQPTQVSQIVENYGIIDLLISSGHLYLAESLSGLVIFDLTDPEQPQLTGHYDTEGISLGVAVYGTQAFVADWNNLGIYDCTVALTVAPSEPTKLPLAFSLSQNYPNPFNPTTVISYQLPTSTQVNLAVFDTNGRLVFTLIDGWQAAGQQTVIFDGSYLVSGTYIYYLVAGEHTAAGKMVLMK